MAQTVRCSQCKCNLSLAPINASFQEFTGKSIVDLRLKCPLCDEEYFTILNTEDFINDNSEKLIIEKQ